MNDVSARPRFLAFLAILDPGILAVSNYSEFGLADGAELLAVVRDAGKLVLETSYVPCATVRGPPKKTGDSSRFQLCRKYHNE